MSLKGKTALVTGSTGGIGEDNDWTLTIVRTELGEEVITRMITDGTIIARLAWSFDASEENNKSFGRRQSFVAGHPKNGVQFMVKDSNKYASTGGGHTGASSGEVNAPSMVTVARTT